MPGKSSISATVLSALLLLLIGKYDMQKVRGIKDADDG